LETPFALNKIGRFPQVDIDVFILYCLAGLDLCELFDQQHLLRVGLAPRHQAFICLYDVFGEVDVTLDS
jgi:hypothetical protein